LFLWTTLCEAVLIGVFISTLVVIPPIFDEGRGLIASAYSAFSVYRSVVNVLGFVVEFEKQCQVNSIETRIIFLNELDFIGYSQYGHDF